VQKKFKQSLMLVYICKEFCADMVIARKSGKCTLKQLEKSNWEPVKVNLIPCFWAQMLYPGYVCFGLLFIHNRIKMLNCIIDISQFIIYTRKAWSTWKCKFCFLCQIFFKGSFFYIFPLEFKEPIPYCT
jgi:hypothetical protein